MARIALITVVLGGLLAGCTQYVNIPKLKGDVAVDSPNLGDVPKVEIAALNYLLKRRPAPGPYAIALPAGTTPKTYERVLSELPDLGTPVGEGQGAPVKLQIARVFIRNFSAQVDVVTSAVGGKDQLISVFLKHDFLRGWYVYYDRAWRLSIEAALRASGAAAAEAPPRPALRPMIKADQPPAPPAEDADVVETPLPGSAEEVDDAAAVETQPAEQPQLDGAEQDVRPLPVE